MTNNTLRVWAALGCLAVSGLASAADVDLADVPMGSARDPSVKPNIMFIFDRSGSMGWLHMPDIVSNIIYSYGYKSSQCNGVYYNPAETYKPPVKADGSSYPDASFTSAWKDGFNTGAGTVNLNTSFKASDWDSTGSAYYYQYNGANGNASAKQPPMSYTLLANGVDVDTSTTFYKECNKSSGAGAAATSTWTKVVINTSSATAVKTNFANWYSYYRTRLLMMKSATGLALNQLNNPESLRIGLVYHDSSGFLPINDYSGPTGVVPITSSCASGATQRAKLYCYLYSVTANGGTPTRTALSRTGQMYQGTGPYITSGRPDPVKFSCQRNSAILATDGYWNNDTCSDFPCVGNVDQSDLAPRNDSAGGSSNSMADLAAYYYKTDLRPSGTLSADNVPTTIKDPANWQHMVTFTLGLGANGILQYKTGYETPGVCPDYDAIVAGTKKWPDPKTGTVDSNTAARMDDLWHAAVNSHGTYFVADTVDALATGLKKAFAEAAAQGSSGAPAPTSLTPVAGDNHVFIASYKTEEWTGELASVPLDLVTGHVDLSAPAWAAQGLLDARTTATTDSRTIFMAKSGGLVPFQPANLVDYKAKNWFEPGPGNPNGQLEQYQFFTATQKTKATQDSIIQYVRGHRGLEDSNNDMLSTSDIKLYRGREHLLGDIVGSSPVYIKEPVMQFADYGYKLFQDDKKTRDGMIYVGANDGMLHAFDATTGQERWAFIPTAVMPYLYKLADKAYDTKHHFYVDGHITVSDVDVDDSANADWRTVLVGTLGKGGRAAYAIDVTNPSSPKLLWEFSATAEGTTSTSTFDADLGFTFGNVSMAKLNGNEWVALMASGYNNVAPTGTVPASPVPPAGDGRARLYVLDPDTGTKKAEIIAASAASGSDPRLTGMAWNNGWTESGMSDASVRHVYAGDLSGQIWRFDLVNETATLLTTVGQVNGVTNIQPVTVRLELGRDHDSIHSRVIYAGTGRYLGFSDVSNTDLQSLYAIRDGDGGHAPLKSNVGGPFFRSSSGAVPLVTGNRVSGMTYNNVVNSADGWYMDFDAQPGERITVMPRLYAPDSDQWLTVVTNVPVSDVCDIGGSSYLYYLNNYSSTTGGAVHVQLVTNALAMGTAAAFLPNGQQVVLVTGSDGSVVTMTPPSSPLGSTPRRISWRELVD